MDNNFRLIPCLLIKELKVVKGMQFMNHQYVGDPMNTIRIFNAKKVDELLVLDIGATPNQININLPFFEKILEEGLMPLAVGGGINTLAQVNSVLNIGAEKVVLNTGALKNPDLIKEAAEIQGKQAVVVAIDVKKEANGNWEVFSHCGLTGTGFNPVDWAKMAEKKGAGEILLTSVELEGTAEGFNVDLIASVSNAVSIPVIANGGMGKIEHAVDAIRIGKASAVAGGRFFVFNGKRRSVLISYPNKDQLILD